MKKFFHILIRKQWDWGIMDTYFSPPVMNQKIEVY